MEACGLVGQGKMKEGRDGESVIEAVFVRASFARTDFELSECHQ